MYKKSPGKAGPLVVGLRWMVLWKFLPNPGSMPKPKPKTIAVKLSTQELDGWRRFYLFLYSKSSDMDIPCMDFLKNDNILFNRRFRQMKLYWVSFE